MKIKQLVDLIDYPDDVIIIIYDYAKSDVVYSGLVESIPEYYLEEDIKGVEIPSKNEIMLNIKTN